MDSNTDVNHVSSAGYTPLHIGVTRNNIDLVTLLMDQNVDVNSRDSRRQTPHHIAAENNYETMIQKLLIGKADPNLKDELGNTSLHLSGQVKQETPPVLIKQRCRAMRFDMKHYRSCSIETIQAIIDHGVDVNAMNNRCQTALWIVCCDGQDELAKILLGKGADPNIADKYGDSSLHSATYGCCSTNVLKEIIDHVAHINATNNDGATALLLACNTGRSELVRLLLKAGADPNITDADGDTCLHGVITADCNKETQQEIIDYGADVNATDKRGRTPLLLGCVLGQIDSVNVLLAAGADTTICDEEGSSCLHAAIDGRCSKDTLQALIDHGAHIDARRKDGANALLRACYTGQSESVRFLLEAGADVNVTKPDDDNCLHFAVYGHCSTDILKKIIEQGVDVNAVTYGSLTALVIACSTCQTESVKVLLQLGADPNIGTGFSMPTLHVAVIGNCPSETLQEIIKYKVDLDAQDKDGRTALLLACENRQEEAVQVLLEAGSNPNIRDNYGFTSLMVAVVRGCRKKIIRAIIDRFADVNVTLESSSALMMACCERREDAIRVLLKAGADTNIARKDGLTCLMKAVIKQCSKKVLLAIIDRGADVNVTHKDDTALMWACQVRHEDAIRVLLKAGADTNIRDVQGRTCLMTAVCKCCSKEVLQAIIDHGTDVNARSKANYTALMWACQERHEDAIRVLLKAGADINVASKFSWTCFMIAIAKQCSKEVLQSIIDHGADVNATNKFNHTALSWACEQGNKDAIHVLLKAGADINVVRNDSKTCLIVAVEHCSKEMLQAIIDHGADVNVANKDNWTALIWACNKRREDAIRVLLKAGADTNITEDVQGLTCLMTAVSNCCSKEMLQAIIDHGTDVNATTKKNRTALMWACQERHEDAIRVLLKAGADTNIVSNSGWTCLMAAVCAPCSKEMLQVTIDHGADVNATNQYNYTALMWACDKKHEDAIHVLLKAGADTNIVNSNGETCLSDAVDGHCSKEVLQAIIDHGADVNATNKYNWTALMWACHKRHEDAIRVLLKAGGDTNITADTMIKYIAVVTASKQGGKEMLEALTDRGAEVNATNKDNVTELKWACKKRHEDAINVVLKTGADSNIVYKNDWTCLMKAVVEHCSNEVLQAIIDHGADVNATNKHNDTALLWACYKGNEAAIRVLLKAGADTNIATDDGWTCLMKAVAKQCSKEVLQAIIDHGADVNATDKLNMTLLGLASKKADIDTIKLLLNAGAEPTFLSFLF